MYVVVYHTIRSQAAFERGLRLQTAEGAPAGARVVQFLPAVDGSTVVCLWESGSVEALQRYVDKMLGETSVNTCYEVAAEPAFARRPLGLATEPISLRQPV
jgi:hypothetical protein